MGKIQWGAITLLAAWTVWTAFAAPLVVGLLTGAKSMGALALATFIIGAPVTGFTLHWSWHSYLILWLGFVATLSVATSRTSKLGEDVGRYAAGAVSMIGFVWLWDRRRLPPWLSVMATILLIVGAAAWHGRAWLHAALAKRTEHRELPISRPTRVPTPDLRPTAFYSLPSWDDLLASTDQQSHPSATRPPNPQPQQSSPSSSDAVPTRQTSTQPSRIAAQATSRPLVMKVSTCATCQVQWVSIRLGDEPTVWVSVARGELRRHDCRGNEVDLSFFWVNPSTGDDRRVLVDVRPFLTQPAPYEPPALVEGVIKFAVEEIDDKTRSVIGGVLDFKPGIDPGSIVAETLNFPAATVRSAITHGVGILLGLIGVPPPFGTIIGKIVSRCFKVPLFEGLQVAGNLAETTDVSIWAATGTGPFPCRSALEVVDAVAQRRAERELNQAERELDQLVLGGLRIPSYPVTKAPEPRDVHDHTRYPSSRVSPDSDHDPSGVTPGIPSWWGQIPSPGDGIPGPGSSACSDCHHRRP